MRGIKLAPQNGVVEKVQINVKVFLSRTEEGVVCIISPNLCAACGPCTHTHRGEVADILQVRGRGMLRSTGARSVVPVGKGPRLDQSVRPRVLRQ